MDRAELRRRLTALAVECDEAGLDIAAGALLLLARCATMRASLARRLINTGHMLVDLTR